MDENVKVIVTIGFYLGTPKPIYEFSKNNDMAVDSLTLDLLKQERVNYPLSNIVAIVIDYNAIRGEAYVLDKLRAVVANKDIKSKILIFTKNEDESVSLRLLLNEKKFKVLSTENKNDTLIKGCLRTITNGIK